MTETTTVNHDHGDVMCNFCWRGHDMEDIAGKLHASHLKESTEKIISAHHKCMQYASNLTQYKFESFGGFMIDDVEKEVLRGSKLKCFICKGEKGKGRKATGACCGCAVKSCRKTFHFPCAYEDSTAITKRLVVTKNKKNKRYILYRVFCSAAHEEAFRTSIKEELRSRKELDDSSSDEKDDNDETIFSKTFGPSSPVSLQQTAPKFVKGSETSLSTKISPSQSEDSSLEPKPCDLSMEDSIADSQLTDDNNKKAASYGARQKLEFVPKGRRSSRILAPSEYSPIPEERSLLNESNSLEKLDSPRNLKDKNAIVVLEDCGSSGLSNVRGILCSKNDSDCTTSTPKVKKELGSVEKGRRTKSSPTKHSVLENHLESAQENAVVDGEQLNLGQIVAKLGTPNSAKKNENKKIVQRENMSSPLKLRVSPRSGVQPDAMLSVIAEVHVEAPMEELDSAASATEHDSKMCTTSSGSLSNSSGIAVAEDQDEVTSASFVICSSNTKQSPSSASSSSGERIYMTGDASTSRKRKTLEICHGDEGDAAAGASPAKRRADSIFSDDRKIKGKVSLSPGKHTCAKQILKSAKAQDNAVAEDVEVPSSHRTSNAALLVFPGDMAHFETVKNQALETVAAEFDIDICNCVVYDSLQELKSPRQLIFFIIDIIGFLKFTSDDVIVVLTWLWVQPRNFPAGIQKLVEMHLGSGDMENLEQLLFSDEFARERATTYNTQIFKVLSNESGRILETLWNSIEKTSANLSTLDSVNNCVAKVLCVEGKRMLAVYIPLSNSSKHICARLKARMGLYRWKENIRVVETFPHLGMEQRNHYAEVESLVLSYWLWKTMGIRKIVVLPEDQYLLDKAAIKINPALNFVQQSFQRWLASLPEGAFPDTVEKACPSTPLLVFQPVVFAVLNFQQYFQEVLSEFLKKNEISRILALIPVTNLHSLTYETISAMASSACAAAGFIVGVSSAYDPNQYPTQLLLFDMQKSLSKDGTKDLESNHQSNKKTRGRPRKNGKTS